MTERWLDITQRLPGETEEMQARREARYRSYYAKEHFGYLRRTRGLRPIRALFGYAHPEFIYDPTTGDLRLRKWWE